MSVAKRLVIVHRDVPVYKIHCVFNILRIVVACSYNTWYLHVDKIYYLRSIIFRLVTYIVYSEEYEQ